MAASGRRTHHFIASSASTILNSRARVEAYAVSESWDGRTAVPTRTPSRSAAWRRDWPAQIEAITSARIVRRHECLNKIVLEMRKTCDPRLSVSLRQKLL